MVTRKETEYLATTHRNDGYWLQRELYVLLSCIPGMNKCHVQRQVNDLDTVILHAILRMHPELYTPHRAPVLLHHVSLLFNDVPRLTCNTVLGNCAI